MLGYTVAPGIPELRAKIAAEYALRYGVPVDPEEVVITTGSSAGFQLAILAAFEAGDQVAITRPGYPAYRNTLVALGCRVVDLDVGPANRFQPTVAMLDALPEAPAGLVVASPSNPTGTIIDTGELAELAAWCARHDCLLISDEIYHQISYGRPCASARQFGSDAVVVGSVSKYHSMTGWRLGWLLLPKELRRPVELLQGNLAICAPAVSQAAALAAFSPEARAELDGHVARYARNRDLLLRRLPELGVTTFAPPDGAFYAWADCSTACARLGVPTPTVSAMPQWSTPMPFIRRTTCSTSSGVTSPWYGQPSATETAQRTRMPSACAAARIASGRSCSPERSPAE